MENKKTSLIMLVLVVICILLGARCFVVQKQLTGAKTEVGVQNMNTKTLEFTKLFIEKVLKADKEVDFETRLSLENSVRGLNNENILIQWQKFTDSKTEADAQREVKNLLQLLVNNLKS
jgi:hypothetical protein